MSEPTKAAMKAARAIDDAWRVPDSIVSEMATAIDDATGLPELVAVCKKALDYRNAAYVPNMLFQRIEDALRKAGEL